MKIRAQRLLGNLSPHSFSLAGQDDEVGEIVLARHSQLPGLFELALVSSSGKQQEAIVGEVGISVARGYGAIKGLIELQILLELAEVAERGWSIVDTERKAREWEGAFSQLVPERVTELAQKKGKELLETTKSAREAADGYYRRLRHESTATALSAWLSELVSPEQAEMAEAIAAAPGVVQIRSGLELYRVAALAMVAFSEQQESRTMKRPDDLPMGIPDQHDLWVLQLVVDKLLLPDRPGGPVSFEPS